MANEFKVIVGVDLDDSSFKTLKSKINGEKAGNIKVELDIEDAQKEINSLRKQIQSLSKMKINIGVNTAASKGGSKNGIEKTVSDLQTSYRKLKTISKNIGSIKIKLSGLDSTKDIKQIQVLESQLEKFTQEYHKCVQKIKSSGKGNLSSSQWQSIQQQIDSTKIKLDQLSAKVTDAKAKLKNGLVADMNAGKFENQFDKISRGLDNIKGSSKQAQAAYREFTKAYNALNNALQGDDTNKIIAANNRYIASLQKVENQLKQNQRAQQASNAQLRKIKANDTVRLQSENTSRQIERWMYNNSAATSRFGAQLQKLQIQLKTCDSTQLNHIKAEFDKIKLAAEKAGLATQNFGDRLKSKLREYSSYFLGASAIMELTQAIRYMYRAVLEVDTAMTGLYRVTDLTSQHYDELYDNMIASAKEYGATLSDIINATSDWVRAGFDAETAVGLAEVTTMYQHVSDLDYDEAAENLLTSYNAYKDELLNAYGGDEVAAVEYITDVLNELDNKFSVTSAGLGEGLARSASALELAGNTYTEAAAMIGAVTEVTQDPEKAGSAMKILSLRLRGMKGQLQELGEETDENVESISKMQTQILNMTGGKVNIFKDNGDFKSTYDIMVEIAEVYDELSEVDQADLLETIAGKNRANDVAALISNMENAIAMNETAMDAAGSAARENENYVESLQGHIDALTATWQAFANTVMESDFLKGLIKGATGVLDFFDNLIDKIGLIPTLIGTALGAMSFKNLGLFRTQDSKLTTFFNQKLNNWKSAGTFSYGDGFAKGLQRDQIALSNFARELRNGADAGTAFNKHMTNTSSTFKQCAKGMTAADAQYSKFGKIMRETTAQVRMSELAMQSQNKSFSNSKSIISGYNDHVKRAGLTQEQYTSAVAQGNPVMAKYLSSVKSGEATFVGYAGAAVKAKVATVGLNIAMMTLNMVGIMAIGAAISWIVTKFDEWHVSSEELAEKIDEVTTSYKDQHDELKKNQSDFDGLAKSYDKLVDGVNQLTGANESLTAEEYEEYKNVVNQIADMVPSLVSGYDAQGNAILNCAGDVDVLTEAYKKLIIEQNNVLLNGDGEDYNGISDISKDLKNDYEELSKSKDGIWAWNKKNTPEASQALEEMLGLPELDRSSISSYIRGLDTVADDVNDRFAILGQTLKQQMSDMNLELDGMEAPDNAWATSDDWSEYIAEVYEQHPEAVKAAIEDMDSQLDAITKEMREGIAAHMENAFLRGDYSNIDEEMQGVASSIVNGLDSSIINELNESGGEEAVLDYIDGILKAINELEAGNADILKDGFDLSSKFKNGEISFGEYKTKLEELSKLLDDMGLDEEVVSEIKLQLNIDEVNNQYDALKTRLTSDKYPIQMETAEAEEFLKSLSSTEVEVAADLIMSGDVDLTNISSEDFGALVEEQAKLKEALNYEVNIEGDTEWLETFNGILAESASAAGLTEESLIALKNRYNSLDSYDPSTLFEKTANGIKVNREELNKLEAEYQDLTQSDVKDHLDTLIKEYNRLGEEIDKASNASERARLISEREQYADQIEELATYQAQLEGVTGAYQRWIDAQSGTEDYEGYESVAKGREGVQDEIDRGFLGNASKEYIDLLSAEDLVGGTIDDYSDAWKELDKNVGSTSYSIHDFFTLDDDGNVTATGIDRFFEGMRKDFEGSVAKFNEETDKWEYDFSQENLKKIEKEWGMGIEAIQLMLEAAGAAGYDVDWDGILDNLSLDTSDFETLISTAETAQAAFNKLEGVEDVNFNFTATGVEEATTELEKARTTYVDLITNEDGTINLEAEGAEEMRFILTTLIIQKQQLSTPAVMKVDTSQLDESKQKVSEVINAAQNLQTAYENYEIAISTGIDVEGAQTELNNAISALEGTDADIRADLKLPTNSELQAAAGELGSIKVGATLDGTSVGALETKITTECTPEVIAKVTGLDESAINNAEGGRTVTYTPEHSAVDAYVNNLTDVNKNIIFTYKTEGTKPNPSDIERKITYTYEVKGDKPVADGTAHANGTAFANGTVSRSGRAFKRGDWGIKGSGVALGGELGQELVVRDGRFFTIGDQGAEFFHYKSGDIIFNAGQTKQLFEQGKISNGKTRGRALVAGTAFANGSFPSSGLAFANEDVFWDAYATESNFVSARKNKSNSSSSSSKSKSSSKSSSSSNDSDEFLETIDWIEIAIDRIERAISKLDLTASSVFKKWSTRNKNLIKEIAKVQEEIDLQERGAARYLQEANSVGLSYAYKKKVQNGEINIEEITDEDLKEKIDEYEEWYTKYLDCLEAAEELRETENELYAQRFENIQTEYDGVLSLMEAEKNLLEEYINQSEANAWLVSANYYTALADSEQERLAELKEEEAMLLATFNEIMNDSGIDETSEQWVEMCESINDVTLAIAESETALMEYQQTLQQLNWEVFDLLQDRISKITDESEFLIDLMNGDKLYDDKGQFTDQGTATAGLYGVNYNVAMAQADQYAEEIKKIEKELAKDPFDTDLKDRYYELVEAQQDAILSAQDYKENIRDLVEEGIELELDALNELIDKHNEALDSQKD